VGSIRRGGGGSGLTSITGQGAWSTTKRVGGARLCGPSRLRAPSRAQMSRSAPAAACTTSRSTRPVRSRRSAGRASRAAAAVSKGVPSEITEEEVKVFVVTREGSTLGAPELHHYCVEHAPRYMVPGTTSSFVLSRRPHREGREIPTKERPTWSARPGTRNLTNPPRSDQHNRRCPGTQNRTEAAAMCAREPSISAARRALARPREMNPSVSTGHGSRCQVWQALVTRLVRGRISRTCRGCG
jgi:hypothetical protein